VSPEHAAGEAGSRAKPSVLQRFWPLAALTGAVLALDHGTKWWALAVLRARPGGRIVVIPGLLDWLYAENTGAAWSLLDGAADWIRRPLLVTVSTAASVLIIWMYAKTAPGMRLRAAALGLLLGGAVGNLIDRALRGYVVDFVRAHWWDRASWPIFNVADAAILLGVAALFVETFMRSRSRAAVADGSVPLPAP
jgi:signal peptidase II